MAILLNALMPTVSLALENVHPTPVLDGAEWVEVCAAQGSTWVRLAADGRLLEQTNRRPAGTPAQASSAHCPYCLTHGASFGLPHAPTGVWLIWPLATHLLPQRATLVATPAAWLAPAARAPPRTFYTVFPVSR